MSSPSLWWEYIIHRNRRGSLVFGDQKNDYLVINAAHLISQIIHPCRPVVGLHFSAP
jgi:hypothetical protein